MFNKKNYIFFVSLLIYSAHTQCAASISSSSSTDPEQKINNRLILNAQLEVATLWDEATSPEMGQILHIINTMLPKKEGPVIAALQHQKTGLSLLHLAALHKNASLVKKLVHPTNVNKTVDGFNPVFRKETLNGITLLHIASLNNDPETASILLQQKGVRHNLKDSSGETPLHKVPQILPSSTDTTKLIELLIQHGCSLHAKNNDDKTPHGIALHRTAHHAIQALTGATCICYKCAKLKLKNTRIKKKKTNNVPKSQKRLHIPAAAIEYVE
ncbi:MAG: ankyrin repeat domain-containing protein [Candidatus Dependentiae bacterium]